MIAVSSRLTGQQWSHLSFVSTLHLCPVIDRLLADVPSPWQPELRLGLQEALVNAAKHGNKLDPNKVVSVYFSSTGDQYYWIVTDQGDGFKPDAEFHYTDQCLCDGAECGRGLYILHQVFDTVRWSCQGTELHLCKELQACTRDPLFV